MGQPQRGFLTQCDQANGAAKGCQNTIRLSKPRKWRCESCEKIHGPMTKEEQPS